MPFRPAPRALITLLALGLATGAARGAAADDAVPADAMSGPYKHAFRERCAELRPRAAAPPCRRADAGAAGTLRFEVHWIADEPRARSYYLALEIGGRWFVSPSPLVIELESSAAGSYYEAQIDAIDARAVRLPDGSRGVKLALRETIRKYCNECVGAARGRLTQTTRRTTTLTCGAGAAGTPTCLEPDEVAR